MQTQRQQPRDRGEEPTAEELEAEKKLSPSRSSHALEATTGALGVVTGAGLGALAGGPPGAIAGAVIGAAIGAASGWAADEDVADKAEIDEGLDKEIGVTQGSIGAANPQQPPLRVGAFSAASSGAGGEAGPRTPMDADGPISPPTK